MKSIIKLSLSSLLQNKRNTALILSTIVLSVTLLIIIAAFFTALYDMQLNYLYSYFTETGLPQEEIRTEILYEDSRGTLFMMKSVGGAFFIIGIFVSVLSISSALHVNYSEKVKTLSVLTTLGCKTRHKLLYLTADILFLSLFGIAVGILIGFLISNPFIKGFNGSVGTALKLQGVIFLRGELWIYLPLFSLIAMLTVSAASLRPALRFIRSTPVELAKMSENINIKLRKNFIDRFLENHFGISFRLASVNYTNNKRKYRMFSASVSVSAVIFILVDPLKAYIIQMYSTSDGIIELTAKEQIIANGLFAFVRLSLAAALASCLIASCCIFISHYVKRKAEFAILLSNGIKSIQLHLMVIIEAIYYGLKITMYILICGYVGNRILYNVMEATLVDKFEYVSAKNAIFTAIGAVIALTVLLSLYMVSTVKRIKIIDELKREF